MKKIAENKGFTIVESLAAVTILSIVLVAVISIISVTSNVIIRSSQLRDLAAQSFSKIEKSESDKVIGKMKIKLDNIIFTVDGAYLQSGEDAHKYVMFK